jgi:hypothetical protein
MLKKYWLGIYSQTTLIILASIRGLLVGTYWQASGKQCLVSKRGDFSDAWASPDRHLQFYPCFAYFYSPKAVVTHNLGHYFNQS